MFGGLNLFFDRVYGITFLKELIANDYIELPTDEKEEQIQLIMDRVVDDALKTAGYIILK